MSVDSDAELPDVAKVLSVVLRRVEVEQQPLLISIAERLAALRYRAWADDPSMQAQRDQLLACADREEEIADRVEGGYPDAADLKRDILEHNPDLIDINRTLFGNRPLLEQFLIQARGERLGAATWRSFAAHESDASRREVLLGCARLEEESALVLEAILAAAA